MRAIVFLLLLLALPAWGAEDAGDQRWNTDPDLSDGVSGVKITSEEARIVSPARIGHHELYFHFDELGAVDSNPLVVDSASVLFCLNPADDSDGADTATVWVRKCLGNGVPATDNNCPRGQDIALTGAGGAEGTQNACWRGGPGKYYVEIVGDGNDDEDPYVSATAEE